MKAGVLEIEMITNVARLVGDMATAQNSVKTSMGNIETSIERAKNVILSLGAGVSVGMLVSKFKEVAVETEMLRGSLVTMTGSSENAGMAFDALTDIARRTPFTLDQSVNAFIKLRALGLEPSEKAILSYGNTASAMGKDLNQMIEAVADASTMEFERLKEFGIKARQEGENVSFTFQGVTTTVGKNAEEIQNYLLGIGETKFGDAMANQMERLPGKLSNLQDNVDALFRAVGDSGGIDLFGTAVDLASTTVSSMTESVDDLIASAILVKEQMVVSFDAIKQAGQSSFNALSVGAGGMVDTGIMSLESWQFAFLETFDVAGDKGIGVIQTIVRAWSIGMVNITASVQNFGVNVGSTIDKISLFFGMSSKSALEFAEEVAKINMATSGAQRQIQAGANAAFVELDKLRDQMIENRRETGTLVHESATLADVLEVLEVQSDDTGDAIRGMTQKEKDLIEKLEQKVQMIGLSAREQAILNQVTRLGSDATQEAIEKVTELAGRLHDESIAQKAAANEANVHRNMVENLQREWANLIDTFIDGESDIGDFFDTFAKGIKRVIAEAAAADLASLIFGNGSGGNLAGIFSGASNLFGGGSGGSFGNIVSGAVSGASGGLLSGLFTSGSVLPASGAGNAAWASFYGAGSGGGGLFSGLGASIAANPLLWGAGALLGGQLIHNATNDPDGFHRAMGGFLGAPTPGAPRGSTFSVSPFASGFTPIGFADGPTTIADATRNIDQFRFLDQTIFDLVSQIPGASMNTSRSTFGGFNVDGVGNGTFFGAIQRTTEAQFIAPLDRFAGQLGNHIEGLTPDAMARIAGASSAQQLVDVLASLTESVDKASETNLAIDQGKKLLTDQQRSSIVSNARSLWASRDPEFAEQQRRERVQRNLQMRSFGYSFVTGEWDESLGGRRAYLEAITGTRNNALAPEVPIASDPDFNAAMHDFVGIVKDWQGRGLPPERT